ncbi:MULTISPECIES: hypothetical protein [Enterobacter]|uniref:hypothetical protein n=1 Tax=Enterobacter TaxID=547 RepID=UPI00073C2438|nr:MULTISPECIES: hypothetical protein [Enterobacter]KSZ03877.1 hypothetical protein APU17_11440 [Enterobacter sp. 50858885]MCC2894895.1 hypothetical protein [Enterobacter hormaechei]MCC2906484.1 hypothetical protein [Enterobacter hormaechei]MCC2917551.1 hypothetical protein [Enterobacter hormaechei]MCC2922655.1 hypothetical protein [Enterobacter hormaechei]
MNITPQDVGSFFQPLIVPIVTGVAAAWFTARFALNRFYHEKWWEKKHTAYSQLIDDLIEIKKIYSQAYGFFEVTYNLGKGQERPKDYVEWNQLNRLHVNIRRHHALAQISLSKNSEGLLWGFFEQQDLLEDNLIRGVMPEFEAYHQMIVLTDKLIKSIVIDAGKELKFK